MDPGKFISLLHGRNPCTIDQFFRLFADNPLHEKAAGLVVNALEFLHIKKFVVRELTVKFERMPVLFGGPGRLIIVIVRVANAGNSFLYDFFLLSQNSFCSGFDEEGFGEFGLVEFIILNEAAVLGGLNHLGHLGRPGGA